MIHKNTMEEYLWRYFDGKSSLPEIKAINQWLDESKENVDVFAFVKKAYIEIEANSRRNPEKIDKAYNQFLTHINKVEALTKNQRRNTINFFHPLIRYALVASIVIITALCTYLVVNHNQKVVDDAYCEIFVPYGGRTSLALPDGSEIWLNAGSKFKYSRAFDIKSREVYLDGEAYFDVEKSKHPFMVHTSHLDILVLGTAFNVKSYSEDEDIETTLVEGNIQIEQKESDKTLYLKPRQKLTYYKSTNQFQTNQSASDHQPKETVLVTEEKAITPAENIAIEANVNTDESTSWKDGKLIINNEPLEELTKKLERKYDIVFQFNSEELKKYSYSGTLRDFPLEQVLRALELTSPIKYSIREKTVFLYYNKYFKPSSKNQTNN